MEGEGMRRWLMLVAVVLMFQPSLASGQTASDIEAKYGKPVSAYPVAAHIWMTPEYTAGGEICRMRLYPKRISENNNYLINQLPFEEFNKAVEGLVPLNARGAKTEPFGDGLWTTGGGVMWTTFKYERVTIMYSAGFKIDAEALKKSEPFDFSLTDILTADKKSDTAKRAEDDFAPYQKSNAEMVTITWNDRKCA